MTPGEDSTSPKGVLIVTGTGTGIGKTVVTAAVAALARDWGSQVAVVKPAQTGLGPDEPGDVEDVERLSGVADTHELTRYPAPLAPEAAARLSGQDALDLAVCAKAIETLGATRDLVLVEGAGGLLVRFAAGGWTIADLAVALRAPALLVVAPDLGTLNHTALTLEALERRRLAAAGLVIGSWPEFPDLASRSNLDDLEALAGRPLSGAVASRAGTLTPRAFLQTARAGLGPELGGRFDATDFRHQYELSKGMR